jgi:VWFA-related protein
MRPTLPRLLILVSLLPAAAAAAESPKIESQRPPLVTVNVVATDGRQIGVRDLRPEDLRIYDAGRPVEPVFCRALGTGGWQAAPLQPHEYSNRPIADQRSIVILFDLLNASQAERGFAWNEIAHAFRGLQSSDRLFVYLLTKEGSLYPIREAPSSPGVETAAAGNAELEALLKQAMNDVNRLRPWELQVNMEARMQKTLAALEAMGASLNGLPGRKSLLWISHGLPVSPSGSDHRMHDYTAAVRSTGADLAAAGITVYAVAQQDRRESNLDGVSTESLSQIAALTGGQLFPSDTTEAAVERLMTDSRALWQVGYYPPSKNWDDKFHTLRLVSARKDLRLRAPAGYFADASRADPQSHLAQAALGPIDLSEIGIRVTAVPSATVAGWAHLEIHVDAADLQLERTGELFSGQLNLSFAAFTDHWDPNVTAAQPVKLDLTDQQRRDLLRAGVAITRDQPVPAAVQRIRVVVQDPNSGAAGSVTIPASAWSPQKD